jgi:membrane protease YdiL (CAAX protease family)
MWALDGPLRPAAPILHGTPAALIATLGAGFTLIAIGVARGWVPEVAVRVAGVGAGHGALLVTALAWTGEDAGAAPAERWPRGVAVVVVLVLGAAAAASLGPLGAVAYLATPMWVWTWDRRRGGALGIAGPVAPWTVVGGALAGTLLGGHLLVAASRTLGHQARVGALDELWQAVAYDAGANVLSAECFFRGALFQRVHRRWSLRAAVTVSAAACLLRYAIDPHLPKTVEMAVGAAFYLALLSGANCWLLRVSGSLWPGYVSALLFFACYRCLAAP